MKPSILATALLTTLLSSVSFATTTNNVDIAANPSATFWGLGGTEFIGSGQGLLPFGGDVNSIFYGALEAAGSFKKSNGYSAGIAAGYRNIVNNSFILGGYVFADYNRSPEGHNFWVANPGIEALGNVWEFRVNGYIPTTCRHWIGDETLAENLGITQFERAVAHDRFDHLFQEYEEVGPGIDAEIGRRIPVAKTHNLRIYVGGYHYFMDKTDNITGAESRIVYPINNYVSIELRDSYDKIRKNVFMGGIRLTFGGNKDCEGIRERLSTPIEHNFGNFASANSIAVGNEFIDTGVEYHLPGSFWYFDNAAINSNSTGDGTIEHPFNAIDPRSYQIMTNSGAASQNIQMYVATGISPYDLSVMPNQRLLLPYGDSIFGRTDNFKLAAKGNDRPELVGGITAFGSNNINDIQLQSQNNGFGTIGALYLNGAQNVNINDININISENSTDAYGISEVNSSATINNSVVTVNSSDNSKHGFGINLENSALFVNNNNYIHSTLTSTDNIEGDAGGIVYENNSTATISGSNNQIIAEGFGDNSHAVGILDKGFGTLILSGNNNHIIANSDGLESRAGGIVDLGIASTTIISGSNNQVIANAAGLEGKALGIGELGFLDFGKITISDINKKTIISGNYNQIIANSAESDSVGILNGGGLLTIAGNHNLISANSATQIGLNECNAGGIINLGDLLTISGNHNQISANSAGNATGISTIGGPLIISGDHNLISANAAAGSVGAMNVGNMLLISGDDNLISANSTGSAIGIANIGDILTITGNDNQISANSVASDAIGILDAGTVTISGKHNYISAHAAANAYGIFLDPTITSPTLSVKNTIFNVATTGSGTAAGISLGTVTDASKIILQNNRFNVAATGAGANAYGIYLPNATTPALIGNITDNIFNITNAAAPQNAWGVYANSSWGSSAAWIRAHNSWINPTSATPQQQVFTNGAGNEIRVRHRQVDVTL